MEEKIIKFEDISKANASIKPINIERTDKKTGDKSVKEYAEVNQRIKAFRMVYPMGCIKTEMISNVNGVCIFRTEVMDENGILLGTGTAYEKENGSFINKTSYIENAETSSVGRALGMCGFGIDTSVASYEEVKNAQLNQEQENNVLNSKQASNEFNIPIEQLPKGNEVEIPREELEKFNNIRKQLVSIQYELLKYNKDYLAKYDSFYKNNSHISTQDVSQMRIDEIKQMESLLSLYVKGLNALKEKQNERTTNSGQN